MRKIDFIKCENKLSEIREKNIKEKYLFSLFFGAAALSLAFFIIVCTFAWLIISWFERVSNFYLPWLVLFWSTILFLSFFWVSLYAYIHIYYQKNQEINKRKKIIRFWYFWTFKFFVKTKKLCLSDNWQQREMIS